MDIPNRPVSREEVERLNEYLTPLSDLHVDEEMDLYFIINSWETLTYGAETADDLVRNYTLITGSPIGRPRRVSRSRPRPLPSRPPDRTRGGVSCPIFC